MRVLLVVYDNDSYIHWFPQGLAYIAAVMRNQGVEVEIYSQDVHHYPDSHLTETLDRNRFDMVGISVIAGYYQYAKLLGLSEAINRSRHRPLFLLGGHGPAPEPAFFFRKTGADIIVVGEGEDTVADLLKTLAQGGDLANVKGIAWRRGESVHLNPRRELIQNIDRIPLPAYDLFPMEYYRLLRMPGCSSSDFVLPMLSGRGCPFHCNFCYRMDEGFRARSSEAIVKEIQLLKERYRVTYVAFSDELLMSSIQRTEEICEAFIREKLNVKWDCNGRLNYARPDLLRLMRKAGCVFINYGIEAFDDQILRNMNKALTTRQIVKGIEATLAAGISPGVNIIFGNIGETRETLRKGVEFLLKYDDGAQLRTIRPVTPYPGSDLYDHAVQAGLLKDVEEFYEKRHTNSDLMSVNFTNLTDEEFHQALCEANKRLIENYFENKKKVLFRQTERLYLEHDTTFRGYRQT